MPPDEVTWRQVAGRYEMHELLGRGGMGSVWRGEDVLLERPVAIKRVELPASLAPEDREALRKRVLREARAAARVSHPRLVTVFDVVEEEGNVFLVQELVNAPTLKALVLEKGPLEPREAARIGRLLLEGLAAAHRSGVVHRDVKPGNVMVLEDGGVKLADFGIASITGDPQLTVTGMILGSPAYMAPEQATGAPVTPAVDIWSVGATLYFAVEGEPPFGKADTIATLTAVVHDPPRQALKAGPLCPMLDEFLAKDPAQRPDVTEAARLLEPVATPTVRSGRVDAPEREVDRPRTVQVEEVEEVEEETAPPPPPPPVPRQRRSRQGLVTALVALALGLGLALAAASGREGEDPAATADDPGAELSAPAPTTAAPNRSTDTTGAPRRRTTGGGATSSAAVAVPADWKTYTDPDTGYRVAHPPDWTIRDLDKTRTDFTDPATGTYLRIDWTDEPGESPEGAWQALSKSFGARKTNYREIRIEPTTYQGHRAALWEYTYDEGGTTLHAYNLGMVTDEYGFALNFQTTQAGWEASQPLWEQLKAGFVVPEDD
ncbi:MAG: protein kinase [Actinomycetota bacterium]|nr:protein kinase [Actinomycetota bacterium]